MHPFPQSSPRPRSLPPLLRIAGLLLALCACGETSNKADVYEETVPAAGLDSTRTFTYRITLFEYSQRVGGFIEFYAIDGQRNTLVNPYFEPTACDYFGAGRLQNDQFPIQAGTPTAPFLATVTRIARGTSLLMKLTEDGNTWPSPPSTGALVTLDQVNTRPARACPDVPSLDEL